MYENNLKRTTLLQFINYIYVEPICNDGSSTVPKLLHKTIMPTF